MTIDNPQGTDAAELSFEDAAAAYANLSEADEPDTGQSEAEHDEQGDEADDVTSAEDDDLGEDEGQAEDDDNDVPAEPAYVADDAKVKLADGTEMTVAELKNGTLRLQDYRQKTEAVAAEKKAYAAKSEQIQQLEQQVAGDREYMVSLLQAIMPAKPDANLASVDPVGYVEANARYNSFKENLDYLLSQNQQTATRRQAEQQETLKEVRAREWQATLEKMPELKDGTRLQSFVTDINRHGTETYGFTHEELQNISLDHRQAVVLRDAIAWRKLQASKSKVTAKVENRPPVQRGGSRQSPEARTARDAKVAMDRLNSSGSLRDGVAALLAIEKD